MAKMTLIREPDFYRYGNREQTYTIKVNGTCVERIAVTSAEDHPDVLGLLENLTKIEELVISLASK